MRQGQLFGTFTQERGMLHLSRGAKHLARPCVSRSVRPIQETCRGIRHAAMSSSLDPSADGAGPSTSIRSALDPPTSAPSSAAYLSKLTDAQRRACTSPPARPVQILAGPGSGKTRVLTSRAAWLVLHHKIMPESIVMITFTVSMLRLDTIWPDMLIHCAGRTKPREKCVQ